MNETESILHPTPRWSTVLREQFRTVAVLARQELVLIGLVMVGLSLLAAGNAVLFGSPVDIHPQVLSFPAALLGLFAPLAVWKNESPSRRGYFWSMPVNRAGHTGVRVFDGWLWLMLLLGAYLLWSVGLAALTGGELGIRETRLVAPGSVSGSEASVESLSRVQWTTPLWSWIVPLTAATATYILGTVATLRSDVPWLWFGGVAVAYFLLKQTAAVADLSALDGVLTAVTSGPYGLEMLVTGTNEELSAITGRSGERLEVWRRLPEAGRWARATAVWGGLGLVGVLHAAFRHPEA